MRTGDTRVPAGREDVCLVSRSRRICPDASGIWQVATIWFRYGSLSYNLSVSPKGEPLRLHRGIALATHGYPLGLCSLRADGHAARECSGSERPGAASRL